MTTTETTMTEVDMMFQVAARRIQGLTAKVNYWKERAAKLESELGVEKAARTANSVHAESEAKAREWGTENKRLRAEVADLEKQRDGFATQVQDMRNEIARLRADLRAMSERSDGSEWEKKEAEIEELRAELNLVKQERDCAKSEWDRAEERYKELTEDIEVIRIELRESQKEAVTARQDSVTREEADRVRIAELFSDRQRLNAELAVIKDERNELRAKLEAIEAKIKASTCEPNTPTPRSHPVKVGEWVKNDNGDVRQVRQVREVYAEYLLTTGWRWAFEHCTPCDPPESTEQMMLRREREFAVKEAADNAVEESENDTAQGDDIKVGDYVEVFQSTDASWTRAGEVGIRGTVQRIDMTEYRIPVVCLSNGGEYALRDVRKIQREPRRGNKVRMFQLPPPSPSGTEWDEEWGKIGDIGTISNLVNGGVRIRETGYEWPLSCIEIVDVK